MPKVRDSAIRLGVVLRLGCCTIEETCWLPRITAQPGCTGADWSYRDLLSKATAKPR
jgi:hypothetical protein